MWSTPPRRSPAEQSCASIGLPTPLDADRFGVAAPGRTFDETVRRILAQPKLELVGLDHYLGSQVSRFGGYERAIRRLAGIIGHVVRTYGVHIKEINLGGGQAVPAADGEASFPIDAFAARALAALRLACGRERVPVPDLVVTPGRAVVARAGVALYRVVAVRREPEGAQLVAVDGGLSDNPRPALYGARYTAVLVGRVGAAADRPSTIVGRHDESGDILARGVPLPADLRPGDLLAAPGQGRTTCRWRRTTTSCRGHRSSPSVAAARSRSSVAKPSTMCSGGTPPEHEGG